MLKLLSHSLREYRRASMITPILVALEVVMECIIPFITARLVNEIKAGCGMDEILRLGTLLVLMAALSLLFGSLAGLACSTASCGLGKNLGTTSSAPCRASPSRTSTTSSPPRSSRA